MVVPSFPDKDKAESDFNDVHKLYSIDEVKNQTRTHDERLLDNVELLSKSILEKRNPNKKFSCSFLPSMVRDYIEEASNISNLDPIMVTVPFQATVAGFFKTSHCIPDGEYYQPLYPLVWELIVLSSGAFKSTGLNAGRRIAQKRHNKTIELIEKKKEELGSEYKENDYKKTFEKELRQDIMLPELATSASFLEDLSHGFGDSIFHHEFSVWLSNMGHQYNADFKALLTTLYDVPETFTTQTKTSGSYTLKRPFASVCAVSAPSWIKEQITPKDIESGFFARFLLFCPVEDDSIPDALPKKKDLSGLGTKESAIADILDKASAQSRIYSLPSATMEVMERLHYGLYEQAKTYDEKAQAILKPFLKRWSPYLLKLAMLYQPFFEVQYEGSLRQSGFEITEPALLAAASIIDHAIKSTVHVFEKEIGETPHQQKCRKVLEYIARQGGRVTWEKLNGSHTLEGGTTMYQYALDSLMASGDVQFKKGEKKNSNEYFLASPQ